jgi:hypothetical protein
MKGNHAKSRRWCYVWMLPLVWVLVSFAAANYPGDEYGLWGVGSMAGVWIIAIVGNVSSVWKLLPFVLVAGAASMAVVGLLLDLLRTPRRWWVILWGVTAVAFCVLTIASYPSYQRAMGKNGSLQAYIFFSLNMGLYATCLIMLLVMPVWRFVHRRPPPGHCAECGYNLTGNVSGRGPVCGRALTDLQESSPHQT